jgi:hypothetical protein
MRRGIRAFVVACYKRSAVARNASATETAS